MIDWAERRFDAENMPETSTAGHYKPLSKAWWEPDSSTPL
jgi:hypothetical protein